MVSFSFFLKKVSVKRKFPDNLLALVLGESLNIITVFLKYIDRSWVFAKKTIDRDASPLVVLVVVKPKFVRFPCAHML